MPTTPILVPMSHSHLMTVPKPKKGLTITFSTDTHTRKVKTTVQHLERRAKEASTPLIVTPKPSADTVVKLEPVLAQEHSDIDLETGKISIPTLAVKETTALVYKTDANIEDYKAFTSTMFHRESSIWDREKIAFHPDLFYESYFQDYQYLMDLRQKGNARIQSFNVKVTRQEQRPEAEVIASSKANGEKLEAKFHMALNNMHDAFEEAYTFEQSDIVVELRNHLVNPAIAYMANLFVSSRCRTCYQGR